MASCSSPRSGHTELDDTGIPLVQLRMEIHVLVPRVVRNVRPDLVSNTEVVKLTSPAGDGAARTALFGGHGLLGHL